MPRNPNHVNVVTAADIENMRRTNGPQAVDAKDIISGKVDGRATFHCAHVEADPRWFGSQVTCTFTAPFGSKEQVRHVQNAHVRKLTAEQKRRAQQDEAKRTAIYPQTVECGCGRIMKPNDPPHRCNGVKETGPSSADLAAAAFRRAGLAAALKDLEQD
jgi:hypothetical protein